MSPTQRRHLIHIMLLCYIAQASGVPAWLIDATLEVGTYYARREADSL